MVVIGDFFDVGGYKIKQVLCANFGSIRRSIDTHNDCIGGFDRAHGSLAEIFII